MAREEKNKHQKKKSGISQIFPSEFSLSHSKLPPVRNLKTGAKTLEEFHKRKAIKWKSNKESTILYTI